MGTAAASEDRTRWASNGDIDIAYRVLGDGPMDIVFLGGFISHIEVLLEEPGLRRWFERLGRSGRVILVDRRGTGMSSMPAGEWALEDEVADLECVLDAVGSERAVLQAYAAGGPLSMAFAALRPERTLALLLYAAMAAGVRDDEVTWAFDHDTREARLAEFVDRWGSGVNLDVMAPSAADDERMRAWLGRLERQSMSPSALQRLARTTSTFDVKHLIGQIRVPTLILHRTDDALIDVRHSRYLAERIAGARFVELPGVDSLPTVGDSEAILGEMEAFLTGSRRSGELDRELLTVLFTDIVDATTTAARIGDARWRSLLAEHDDAIRSELARFGGEEIKTIGDSVLAAFAGPPSQAVRCAQAIMRCIEPMGIEVRCGLHTGECERVGGDVGGMAVHIAARVTALAGPGEVLLSGTTYGTVVGSGLAFADRGQHELRGVPGRWPVFALAR